MNFNKETILITGASNGIGRGLALSYADEGATVVMCDIDEEHGRQLLGEIREKGQQGYFFKCDVSQVTDIEHLFQQLDEKSLEITILINNAGASEFKSLFDLEVKEWDQLINTNLRSVFLFSKYTAERWKANQIPGRIVNMASTRAFMSEPNSEGYAASKGGITAITHALAASLAETSIRVNSISPGWIQTDHYDQLRPVDHNQHLAGRVGTPDDIAKACFYLTDEANDFVTGENIIVDGGMTRKMIYEH
ncbi:SDR family NAD(P)-dependent oxidoreductase [Halobacillus amylolyticus]|uniref:SDR family oxidoreductase n=1 Tax=Halobacillus amylolyticus TaxID=2932259 RepID=A0ABY4HE63_9BACI|nr:SDR family oxidoreductase [Halobacillus amylolyticus]UOR13019.1 SDR family oxidoreductase [Halobacillus amylolyticus]